MVGRTLHWISVLCCAFVVISFALFAHAQVSSASSHQAGLIAPPKSLNTSTTPTGALGISQTSTTATTVKRHKQKGQPRRFIDAVASKLESPFSSVVSSTNAWVNHLIPFIFALLVYGAGLGFLSRWADGRS